MPLRERHLLGGQTLAANLQVTTKQSCYLPFTRDSVPCMGKAPQHDNVFVATGHGCWGILLSLASGQVTWIQIEKYDVECRQLLSIF